MKSDSPLGMLCWVQAYYPGGVKDAYLLTLGIATGPGTDSLMETQRASILASVQLPDEKGLLHEGLADDGFCQKLLQLIAERGEIPTHQGILKGSPTSTFGALRGPADEPLKIGRKPIDQSNSSIFYGNRFFLKLFRRLQPGINPDWEIGRYLTEQTSFDRIAKMAGALEYFPQGKETVTLAILEGLVENQGSGWEHTLDELSRYFERVQSRPATDIVAAPSSGSPDVTPVVNETVNGYLHLAETLGKRTGELHLALAQNTQDPAFRPERLVQEDLIPVASRIRQRLPEALATIQSHLNQFPEAVRAKGRQVLQAKSLIEQQIPSAPAVDLAHGKIRCHGDFHLNQTLWSNNDFIILDFEGEPARPLSERRMKQSPLRDVAGMLRSLHYAAYTGLTHFTADRPEDFDRLEPWARFWFAWSSTAYMKGYRQTVQEAGFLPPDPAKFQNILNLFLWEKVLYELAYEMNNRPDWALIPLEGILSLLALDIPTPPASGITTATRS